MSAKPGGAVGVWCGQKEHCFHPYCGVIHMVIPDGHVLVKCCQCEHMETRHAAHVHPLEPVAWQ